MYEILGTAGNLLWAKPLQVRWCWKLWSNFCILQVIPFKFHERKIVPEILDATQLRGELCFVVKWPSSEQLELISSTIMYVEYPLYVFKFYEKCLTWVHFDKS